jgi:hypothetical protein
MECSRGTAHQHLPPVARGSGSDKGGGPADVRGRREQSVWTRVVGEPGDEGNRSRHHRRVECHRVSPPRCGTPGSAAGTSARRLRMDDTTIDPRSSRSKGTVLCPRSCPVPKEATLRPGRRIPAERSPLGERMRPWSPSTPGRGVANERRTPPQRLAPVSVDQPRRRPPRASGASPSRTPGPAHAR